MANYISYTAGEKLTAAKLNSRLPSWVFYNGTGGTIFDNHNVSSVSNLATGNYQVNWDTDFDNATYVATPTGGAGDGNIHIALAKTAAKVQVDSTTHAGVLVNDTGCNIIAFGDI